MDKRKTHIEYDDFGAYEEYLEETTAGKTTDTSFFPDRFRFPGGGMEPDRRG